MTTIPNGSVFHICDFPAGATKRFLEVVGDARHLDVWTIDRR
jgi:hypothetical protein